MFNHVCTKGNVPHFSGLSADNTETAWGAIFTFPCSRCVDWTRLNDFTSRRWFFLRLQGVSSPPPELRPVSFRFILIPVRSFDCERGGEGRPRGHWWLIFWALTDCVSNGALIAFPPPPTHHCKQAPPQKKSIQIPTRWEGRSGLFSLTYSPMCNLKSISSLRQHHLNISRASACASPRADTDPRCSDRGFYTVHLQESGSSPPLFQFSYACAVRRRTRFIKVAQCLSSQV